MRLGMNWPATCATYIGAAGLRHRHSGRIRRACASASAGASCGSLALRMAAPIWKRLDIMESARYANMVTLSKAERELSGPLGARLLPIQRCASTSDFVLTRAAGLE